MSAGSDKLFFAALEKLEKLQRQECFDPVNPASKPTTAQESVISDFGKTHIQLIRAGTQCLAKGTLVATPTGPVAIEDIKIGDTVYSEHGKPIKVLKTFDNGKKKVYQIWNKDTLIAEATQDHIWLTTIGQFKTSELAGKQLVVYDKQSVTPEISGERFEHTYDIHVDSSTNLYLLANGLVTHNSGKSQTCARIVTWVLTETHPHWKRPASWGVEPLLAIIAGRTGKQIEESLLPKIKSYLEPGTYKEVRIGNIIQRLELTNGNRIVFQSLENPNMARERIQSYVAHIAWIDELPPTVEVMDELLRRVQARNGYFLASFTPLVRNLKVQKFVDNLKEPLAKTYRFQMLDNPLYANSERRAEIIASMAHLPEHVRNSRLYGDWMSDDNAVYQFNQDDVIGMPENYSPMWRHVESVDPASSSALGYTLWAEDPATGIWYCVKAEYIKGVFVPTEIVQAVQKLSFGYNIVRRISDTEPWFIHQAAQMGIKYSAVYEKANRKIAMIKALQQALGTTVKIAPHCEALVEELSGMRWSESKEGKIVSSNDYHLHDTAAYFVDNMPKRETLTPPQTSWQAHLWQKHQQRKEAIEKKKVTVMRQALRKGRHHARSR